MSGGASNQRSGFVGRVRALARLTDALDRAFAGDAALVLVSGEAGIGKTALVARLAEEASARGATTAWGTCWHSEQAPGFWPWTQVIRSLVGDRSAEVVAGLGPGERSQLARLVPELAVDAGAGGEPPGGDDGESERARFELFAATAAFLERAARLRPLLVILDDLQWSDSSSLYLLQFIARRAQPVPLLVIGAYRHDEIEAGSAQARVLVELAGAAEPLRLAGFDEEEVGELVRLIAGVELADRWTADVRRRSGGHPFFVRELSHLIAAHPEPGGWATVPAAVREVIERRLARLTPACVQALEAAAVCGNEILPDVLSHVCRDEPAQMAELVDEAIHAGILAADGSLPVQAHFAHDLFRETLYEALPVRRRLLLHQQVGTALEDRRARGGADFPGEMARHFAAAITIDGPERAVRWAVEAARADGASLAFSEAATHLERVRQAAQDSGIALPPETVVDLLVMEAAHRARSGDPTSARALLERAREMARGLPDPDRLAAVALGVQRLGVRMAMPRPQVVEVLEEAGRAVAGTDSVAEAQVTANLARELAHSVFAQRRRARPLSERALEVARVAGDPTTLVSCLLARHDVVWAQDTAAERLGLAGEIVGLAERAGDRERHAEGVLLRANALLELGSPAFRAELAEYFRLAGELRQPRYDYMVLTRRAALALLDGRIGEGERLIDEASALGQRIGEPDVSNVRMAQTLGARWARGDPEQLLEFAEQTVAWWVGIPAYSRMLAAGFLARAGALEEARRTLAVARELDEWREGPSVLRSACVGLAVAAAARLGDRELCTELYGELSAVASSCGVNSAVVCFMGSYAHWAGVAAAALGRPENAIAQLEVALATHERLGALAWEAETCAELADVLGQGGERYRARAAELAAELGLGGVAARVDLPMPPARAAGPDRGLAVLRRDGELWEIGFSGRSARLRDGKGLHDLVVLLTCPGVDVHVLDLASPQAPRAGLRDPALDARARAEYRRRLVEIDEERSEAERHQDGGRLLRLDGEREALLAELRDAAGLRGRARYLGSDATERARKAVTSRVRDAIRRIEAVLPELGAHLDRSVVTGTTCRYQPVEPVDWTLRAD